MRSKITRAGRKAASAGKRRTLYELELLAAKGDVRAKEQLRKFAENARRITEESVLHGSRAIADVRRQIGALSIPEIMQKTKPQRPVGSPRKSKTAEWIEKLAARELAGKPSLRSLVQQYRRDFPEVKNDPFAALRRFKHRHLEKIRSLAHELESSSR
jgi:hypothetical protein